VVIAILQTQVIIDKQLQVLLVEGRGAEGPPGEPGAGCEGAAGRDGPCAARPVAVYSFPRLQQLPDQDARAGGG
ncbi:hypothetical protein H0O53_22160, partial [Escherichia coli]|nr:hypothetical protein [Escherichia coli]